MKAKVPVPLTGRYAGRVGGEREELNGRSISCSRDLPACLVIRCRRHILPDAAGTAPGPTGCAQFVRDDFPVFQNYSSVGNTALRLNCFSPAGRRERLNEVT